MERKAEPKPVKQSVSPLLRATFATGPEIVMTSASKPSSFRNPLFCAKCMVKCAASPGVLILIFSAAQTEAWRRKLVSNATKVFFNFCSSQSAIQNRKLFHPQLPLRLSNKREIRDFAERNIPANFQGLLSLFNHYAKSFFADARILIVDLDHTVVSRRGDL